MKPQNSHEEGSQNEEIKKPSQAENPKEISSIVMQDFEIFDVNNDGFMDVIGVGNNYDA